MNIPPLHLSEGLLVCDNGLCPYRPVRVPGQSADAHGATPDGGKTLADEPRELELKLDLPAIPDPALENALKALDGVRAARPVELVTTYFDTGDGELRRAGLTLRIRRKGAQRVQTLKHGKGGFGLFERLELERRVTSDAPVLNAAETDAVSAILGAPLDADRPLIGVFTTQVRRKAYVVTREGATIEAVIDDAEAHVAEESVSFRELELELRSGEPAALFSLARHLAEVTPLRVSVEAKSTRGYRLRDGDGERRSIKAGGSPVEPGMTVEQAFVAIVSSAVAQFRRNEDLFLADPQPKALHQARVALRRLRSAFKLFRSLFKAKGADGGLPREVKWLAGVLGDARDLDVFGKSQHLDETDGLDDASAHLAERLASARADAYADVIRALHSRRTLALMLDLAEWSAIGGWRAAPETAELRATPIETFAAKTLSRGLKAFEKKSKGLKTLSVEARHKARIRAKTLRYAADFFGPLYADGKKAERYAAFLQSLKQLQARLGDLNDIANVQKLTYDIAKDAGEAHDGEAAFAAGRIAGEAEAPAGDLLKDAGKQVKSLRKAKPFWK